MGWRVKSEKLRRCSCSASSPSFALSLQPLRAASLALACLAATQPTPPRHHCQQAPAPPQHHQPPPPTPTTATTAESSRTWSTFSTARLPRLPLPTCHSPGNGGSRWKPCAYTHLHHRGQSFQDSSFSHYDLHNKLLFAITTMISLKPSMAFCRKQKKFTA